MGMFIRAGKVVTARLTDLCVTTAKIAANAVTLAKMAAGTQGGTLYYGAAGAIAELAAGTSGYFLKTQGVGANPVWDSVGGNIGTVTTATGTNVAGGTYTGVSGLTTRDTFIVFMRIKNDGAADNVGIQLNSDAGADYAFSTFDVAYGRTTGATRIIAGAVGAGLTKNFLFFVEGNNAASQRVSVYQAFAGGTDDDNYYGPASYTADGPITAIKAALLSQQFDITMDVYQLVRQ